MNDILLQKKKKMQYLCKQCAIIETIISVNMACYS